uniref:AP2/ERF domain-containing protein n=1 Tax=Plectus sambesii TaxID=2011161 RepID=A0A914XG88_9BILA
MPPKKRPVDVSTLKRSKRLEENKENLNKGTLKPKLEIESGTESDSNDGSKGKRIELCISSKKKRSAAKPAVDQGILTGMVFPKGTYVIRLRDAIDGDVKWIWRVDHHQLIQKYLLDERYGKGKNGSIRWYTKSFRYCGWFCNEAWNFLILKVTSKEVNEQRVQVVFPSAREIEAARKVAVEENRKRRIPFD